jgi:hypothetical protein
MQLSTMPLICGAASRQRGLNCTDHALCISHRRHEAHDIAVGVLQAIVWNVPDSYLTDALSHALQGIRELISSQHALMSRGWH